MTSEEEAILRAQQLDLIYSQSGILYDIILEALRPTHDAEKPKPGPYADGVVGSVKSPIVESLAKHLHKLSVKHSTTEVAKASPRVQMFCKDLSEGQSAAWWEEKERKERRGKPKQAETRK